MGKAFLAKSNGGGGGIAFRVLGGTSAPSNPKPNDIWVNTSEEITSYIFCATEPEGYAEGMVWITTGTSSVAEFNVLKKNSIQIYPISAKQYANGAWVNVEAKSYQHGNWVDWWDGELYDFGSEVEAITGGWVGYDGNTKEPVVERGADYIKLTTTSGGYNVSIQTRNAIDMTDYSTLVLTGDFKSTCDYGGWGIRDAEGTQVAFTKSAYSIDISALSGSYRPFLQVRNTAEYIKMNKMQLM